MARIIVHEEKNPAEVKVGDENKWVCMCGLSSKKPFCDGSHKGIKEENGKLYKYENGKQSEVIIKNI